MAKKKEEKQQAIEKESFSLDLPTTKEQKEYIISHGYNPDEIVSYEFFKKWMELEGKNILIDYIKIASDGREINLAKLPTHFKKSLEGLEESEKRKFQSLKKIYQKIRGKRNVAKQFALGSHRHTKGGIGKHTNADKILEEKHIELTELFGRFFSIEEVLRVCIEDWKILTTVSALKRFVERHSNKIGELKEKFKRDYSDIRLGYKRSRLDEYQWLYNKIKTQFKYSNSINLGKLMVSILEKIKAEVEGDLIDVRVSGDIGMKIEHTINNHVRSELLKKQNLISMVILRAAQKTNTNSVVFLQRLNNSFYANYMAINGGQPQDGQPDLPSVAEYNYDEIKAVQESKQAAETALIEEAKIIEEEMAEKAEELSLKDKLTKLLEEKEEQLKTVKNVVTIEQNNNSSDVDEEKVENLKKKLRGFKKKKSNNKYYKKKK